MPKETSKDLILRTAAMLINKKGPLGTTIKEIANKAGMTPATLHTMFLAPVVLNIAKEIRSRFFGELKERILFSLHIGKNFSTPLDQLLSVFLATFTVFEESPEFGKMVLDYPYRVDEVEDAGTQAWKDVVELVGAVIKKAREMNVLSEKSSLFTDWETARIVLDLCFSLFRIYFGEFDPEGMSKPSEKKVGVFFLLFLETICADSHHQIIEEKIKMISKG